MKLSIDLGLNEVERRHVILSPNPHQLLYISGTCTSIYQVGVKNILGTRHNIQYKMYSLLLTLKIILHLHLAHVDLVICIPTQHSIFVICGHLNTIQRLQIFTILHFYYF